MDHLTNEEFLNYAKSGIKIDVEKLLVRFETQIDEAQKDIEADLVQRAEAIRWAKICFGEHAGEDFHEEVMDDLRDALEMNKPEMKDAIKSVIAKLVDYDYAAMNEQVAMNDGDF